MQSAIYWDLEYVIILTYNIYGILVDILINF